MRGTLALTPADILAFQELFWVRELHRPLRINILTFSLQSFPDLQPLYDAARSYLEIPQRVDLLNARVEVRTVLPHLQVAVD